MPTPPDRDAGYRDGVPEHPHLGVSAPRRDPRAVALILHGGQERSQGAVSPMSPAYLRMLPFAMQIRLDTRGQIAVAVIRFRVSGWNGAQMSPVADATWALDRLAERFPDRPIGLVGHSMGGRVALRVGGHPAVTAVAALAPWLPPGEPSTQLAGRSVLLVHGAADRMTDPAATAWFAERLRAEGTPVRHLEPPGTGHTMVRRAHQWHRLASGFLQETLLGAPRSRYGTALGSEG
jgi:alpha-beta hydrolase superfamily lysophospholipase